MNLKNFLFILTFSLTFPTFISAQKVATSTPEVNPEIIEKVKDRLEKAKEATISATKWYSYFGLVSNITPSSIVINNNGKENEVRLSPEVELSYFRKNIGKTTITPEEIKIDSFAIAMGQEITNNKNLVATRISFSDKATVTTQKQTIIGKISEIDGQDITITGNSQITFTLAKNYLLKIKNQDKAKLEDISVDDRIIAIISSQTNQDEITQEITALYIIPGLNSPLSQDNQIEEEASPSAEASTSAEATQSAKPKN